MHATRVRSIASLKRGLEVLSLVAGHDGIGLHAMHTASGVPKASLLRILKTLAERGLVRRREEDGTYLSLGPGPAPTSSASGAHTLAETTPGLLQELRERLSWPSDVAVAHGTKMRVIDSNRSEYGKLWRPSVVGEEVDMIDSAMGRAYLAFLPPDACQALVERGLSSGGTRARRREAIARELALTRQRGFGRRDYLYAGPDTHHGRQLSAIAVPIVGAGQVLGCVSCVWNLRATSQAEVLETALAHLVRLATTHGAGLAGPTHEPPQGRHTASAARA